MLANGHSRSERSAVLIDDILLTMSYSCIYSWYARVPTECNIADLPSRLEWTKLKEELLGAVIVELTSEVWGRV